MLYMQIKECALKYKPYIKGYFSLKSSTNILVPYFGIDYTGDYIVEGHKFGPTIRMIIDNKFDKELQDMIITFLRVNIIDKFYNKELVESRLFRVMHEN